MRGSIRKLAFAAAMFGASIWFVLPRLQHVLAAPQVDKVGKTDKQSHGKTSELRAPEAFRNIKDPAERSRTIFSEAGKVILSARCLNCHPAGDQPTQGEAATPHLPAVVRGSDGHGAVGLRCTTCHQQENYEPSRVPGHPLWGLAPLEMAWQQRSLGQICEQIKDPARNGGKTLAQVHEHMAHDSLVGWAWKPGSTREPAPGTQARFGELIGAWIETGAVCPTQ